jgi:CubicO group peptidase (beta-lactamase class C family)
MLPRCLPLLALTLVSSTATGSEWPDKAWDTASPEAAHLDKTKLEQARDYALTGEGSGCIVRGGKLVFQWGDQSALYDLKSSSKAVGVTILGLALKDGKVSLDDPAVKFHPHFATPPEENLATGWPAKITLRHLATQTAGFEKPGGYGKLQFAPGTEWFYSDAGPNWLAECLTYVYQRDLNEVMFERVFMPLGITDKDVKWRKHAYRPDLMDGLKRREFGSGFNMNVNAMARLGLLYLRDGWWRGEQILPRSFIEQVRQPGPQMKGLHIHEGDSHGADAPAHYGLLWWDNADGAIAGLPRDAFWSWGLYDSLILVVPSLDLVVARAGKGWARQPNAAHYDVLKPFFEPIAAAAQNKAAEASASPSPYPPSPVIRGIEWTPLKEIVRHANDSDNWPLTWGDDDAMYTAYGDGEGFEPFAPHKLSMGIAKVLGSPPDFQGINISAPTAEAKGDGKKAHKACGMLMVDHVLYLLVRNVGNAQLGWSTDHGATWTWADWKFTESFGCPSFVNFGKNYAGARDGYVYVCSQDSNTAYDRVDNMVLARVPKDRIRERGAYEFFAGMDAKAQPQWSADISQRRPIFTHAGQCYRSQMTYNAALKRYLWCQTGPGRDTRFAGGFAIYDAPEPWGPWTTVFTTDLWDTGPGESSSIPTKWISADGLTVHLVFSGNDSFSVRRGVIQLR